MVRSDFLMEVRGWFVNTHERRLRAGWRVLVALGILSVVGVALSLVTTQLRALETGPTVRGVGALLSGTAANLVVAGAVVAVAWGVDKRTVQDLGLGGRGWWRNLAFGLLVGVGMTAVVFLLEWAAGLLVVERTLVSRPGLGTERALPFAVAFTAMFVYFVGVGIVEEVLVRGYLLVNVAEGLAGVLGRRGAVAFAALSTSALFGLLHFANPNATLLSTLNIAAAGLVLAWTVVVTDDLGVAIGIHVTWNFALSSVFGFPVSGITTPATLIDVAQTGPDVVTGGRFGPEGGLVVYLALGVAVALTWWWVRRAGHTVRLREDLADPDLRGTRGRSGD